MYGSLFHRYDHASKGSETARSILKESRGLAEILFRINGKERGIGAVIGMTVSLFRDKVEQAIELVTPAKALPENVKWDGTGGVLTAISNLVNNLNSKDNSQILISKEVDRFIKGFAFSIPFIVSSNSAYGTSSFGANHASIKGHEYSTLNSKQEQALKMIKGGDYTAMSGLQEFAILDNTTGSVILASEVGKTPKEGEKFLRDIIAGKLIANANNIRNGNKGKIIPINFLTEPKKNDKISGNTNFIPLKNNMGTQKKGEISQRGDKAPEVVRESGFDQKAASAMAETNFKAMGVLNGDSPESRREAVFDKYSEKRGEVTKMIQSGNYFVSGGTFSEPELRDSLGTKIKFSEFASSVEEGMSFINVTERTLSKTISEAPMGVLAGGKEENDKKVAKGTSRGFSHSLSGGGANGGLSISEEDWLLKFGGNVQLSEQTQKLKFQIEGEFSKVIEFGESKAGFLISMKYSPDEARAIGLTSFKVGDGVISFSASQFRSASEILGKSIDEVTTSGGVGYQHFIKILNFIDSFYATGVYSSTKDHFGVHEDSRSITNLIGGKVFSGDVGVRGNFGDKRDTFDLSAGVSHTSFPGSETGIESRLGGQGSFSLEFLRGLENNYKIYAGADYDSNIQFSGKTGIGYKDGIAGFGPEFSYDKEKGFVGMLRTTIQLGGNGESGYSLRPTTSDFTPSSMFDDPLYRKMEKIRHTTEKETKEKTSTAEALPSAPSITLTDADSTGGTAASGYTNALNIAVSITNDPGVDGWFISESSTAPTTGSTWLGAAPTSFNLSNSEGDHTVYVWVKKGDKISAAGSKTIKVDRVTQTTATFVSGTPNAKNTQYNDVEVNIGQDISGGVLTDITSSNGGPISGKTISAAGNPKFNWFTPGLGGSTLTFTGIDPGGNPFSITKIVPLPN